MLTASCIFFCMAFVQNNPIGGTSNKIKDASVDIRTSYAENTDGNGNERQTSVPVAERDTVIRFHYYNNVWIPYFRPEMVEPDKIIKKEIKYDEYGNRACFFTISSETYEKLMADCQEAFKDKYVHWEPTCVFPGGDQALMDWLAEHIRLPEGFTGEKRVVVGFWVQLDGTITDPEILRGCKDEALNTEALRVISELPKFKLVFYTPVRQPLHYILPIRFRRPDKD